MKKRNPPETEKELAAAFDDLFDEIPQPETQEEIEATLRSAGYNPSAVGARMEAIAMEALANSPLNWRNRASQEMAEARAQFSNFSSTLRESRSEITTRIQKLLALVGGEKQMVGAYYRNLDTTSDNDLASLLAELEFLASQRGHRLDD